MNMRRTPPLSLEGSREVLEEMSKPPADTPERRAMFALADEMRPLVEKVLRGEAGAKVPAESDWRGVIRAAEASRSL